MSIGRYGAILIFRKLYCGVDCAPLGQLGEKSEAEQAEAATLSDQTPVKYHTLEAVSAHQRLFAQLEVRASQG